MASCHPDSPSHTSSYQPYASHFHHDNLDDDTHEHNDNDNRQDDDNHHDDNDNYNHDNDKHDALAGPFLSMSLGFHPLASLC